MNNIENYRSKIKLHEDKKEASIKISYLDKIVEEMKRGNLNIFAGAGLSAASGYVDWKTLLEPMGKMLGLNVNMDLTLLAQYYKNEYTRWELNRAILNEFAKIPQQNDNMEILASLPIKNYWTTNYDSIIEDTLRKTGKTVDVIIEQVQFKNYTLDRDAVVYKMHGDRTFPDSAVLTKQDYELYDEERSLFTQALTVDLMINTFLFIGFSFSDPNLDRIMAIVRKMNKRSTPKLHYCFMRTVRLEDYMHDSQISDADLKQYEQDKNMQELKLKDMVAYGIQPILVENFEQITLMLKYIAKKLYLNSVFISGALNPEHPNDYGAFQVQGSNGELGKAEQFIMQLACRLIDENYKIITGFGVGIGNYVVAGAYMMGENRRANKIEDKILIQPMVTLGTPEDIEIKERIRKILIEKSGIFISIFGKNSKKTVKKEELQIDGTYIEYEIAKKLDKIIIPIGASGFTSEIIYKEEEKNWREDLKEIYQILGNRKASIDDLIENIIFAIEKKKAVEEEKMKESLIHTFNSIKKIFVSFHYKTNANIARKVIKLLNESEKYIASVEEEKSKEKDIQEWIDQKIEDTEATIILFNKEITKSRWAQYELRRSIENDNFLIYLVNKKEEQVFMRYRQVHKEELKKVKVDCIMWEVQEDLNFLPERVTRILKNN